MATAAIQARIPCPVDFAHSARAKGRDDFIWPEFGARRQSHGDKIIAVRRDHR